ncbi:hypothetical protein BB560_006453 [Smittium megazygosporum]|uniref:Transcription factor CBF/NF-Y/archaeal histone domain-containing protein n=1 Tax=Smittium megazygosporum TaxID=133381 RepID=A0A2T9Y5T3_9FUNG|nr:hypothetical protein BB560_006453 [Smittium megazygosporum]
MSSDPNQTGINSDDEVEIKEQDRYLPIANVARIMKRALPENAKISKEAKEAVQECVSEFISFVTSEASDRCQQEKRKTINGEDILWAMHSLGFENYSDALKLYLGRYREINKPEKDAELLKTDDGMYSAQNSTAAAAGSGAGSKTGAADSSLQNSNLAMYMNGSTNTGAYY